MYFTFYFREDDAHSRYIHKQALYLKKKRERDDEKKPSYFELITWYTIHKRAHSHRINPWNSHMHIDLDYLSCTIENNESGK